MSKTAGTKGQISFEWRKEACPTYDEPTFMLFYIIYTFTYTFFVLLCHDFAFYFFVR